MLNCNNEIWKDIVGYEGIYQVSTLGNVRNYRKLLMKTFINNSGYKCIKLTKNKKPKHFLIHKLVLEVFNPNNDNTLEVNHIDRNKLNNQLSNLEWVTSSQNKQHSIKTGDYNKIFTMKNSLGKKHLPNTSSKYHNVMYDKSRNKWVGTIRCNGKNLEPKRFNTEEEAALYVNYIIEKYNLTDRPKNIIT